MLYPVRPPVEKPCVFHGFSPCEDPYYCQGRRLSRNLSEVRAVLGHNLSEEETRWVIDWLVVRYAWRPFKVGLGEVPVE